MEPMAGRLLNIGTHPHCMHASGKGREDFIDIGTGDYRGDIMVVVEGMNNKGVEEIFRWGEGLVRYEGREESGIWKITIGSCMFVPIADMHVS